MKKIKANRYLSPNLAKKRLLFCLIFFALSLSVPVYFLLDKVYSQLENEVWFKQRNQAELLVQRIEQQLQNKLKAEQERPIAEYSFFNVLENTLLKSTLVNVSPLATVPPDTDIPGLLGYFQINPDGSFQIPALPELDALSQTGLSRNELQNRQALKQKLKKLLVLTDKDVGIDIKQNKNKTKAGQGVQQDSAQLPRFFQVEKESRQSMADTSKEKKTAKKQLPTLVDKELAEEKLQKLNIQTRQWREKSTLKDDNGLLKRKQRKAYQAKARKETVRIPAQSSITQYFSRQRVSPKKEKVVTDKAEAIEEMVEQDNAKPLLQADSQSSVGVLSFETEVSPLQLISLGEGYLCFYRNVWSGKFRYIQGFIVNDLFLKKLLQSILDSEEITGFSSLLIMDKTKLIQQYRLIDSDTEILLYKRSLSAPFQQLELFVNSASLAYGSSRNVLDMISMVLMFIIISGLILFYRLGAKQIELSKQQRNFISSVSHELKTPLTSIRMYSELLRTDWVGDEKQKRGYYDYIYFESERLSRLISNVLQLARLDNHHNNLQFIEIECKQLLNRVQAKVAAQMEAADYHLKLIPAEDDQGQLLKIDEDAFFQIMINLVDNAIKFSKQSENHHIDIGYRISHKGKQVAFYVRDYGTGVDKDQRKKIFKLFYRAGDEMTRTQPGTGIGLALVVQLAHQMGASVDQRNCSPGAEFQLKFDLK